MLRTGSGSPVLLLHGFCGAAQGWRTLVDALADEFDLIAPDWPGFGQSVDRAPLASISEMASWVVALADRLGLARFSVVGHSMSGYVVQTLLREHEARVDRAVLYGTGLRNPAASRFESLDKTTARLRDEGADATAHRVCATWFVAGERAPAYQDCVRDGGRMDVAAGVTALRACEGIDFTGTLGSVRREALVVLGDRDRTFRVADAVSLAAAIPMARLCVLPRCAHAAHREAPELFAHVLRDFLQNRGQAD